MAEVISALRSRSPAPLFELANGRQVQTKYLDAVGHAKLREYQANVTSVDLLFELVRLIVPELTREEIDAECSIEDCATLIHIGKGNVDPGWAALKNGESGGESPTPPLTPPSNPTT